MSSSFRIRTAGRYIPSLERRGAEGGVDLIAFQSRLVGLSQSRFTQVSLVAGAIPSAIAATICRLLRGRGFMMTALRGILPVAAIGFRRLAILGNAFLRFGVPLPA
jgi:hypothetical protein